MSDNPLDGHWDFLTLVAWWNLYGLPALLVLAGVVLFALRGRLRESRPRSVAVRAAALILLGIGLRAGIALAQELLTLRVQGIPQSFPVTGIFLPAIALVVNPTIGHYLFRSRPWSRRAAIAWNAVVAVLTALVVAWQWKFQVGMRPDQWPDYLVSVAVPWLLLVFLLLPGTRALFARPGTRTAEDAPRPLSAASIGMTLLLLVVVSTLAVDALDWLVRSLDPMAD